MNMPSRRLNMLSNMSHYLDAHCIDDFRELPRRALPRTVFDFIDGGAGSESSALGSSFGIPSVMGTGANLDFAALEVTVGEQITRVLRRIDALLAQAGSDKSRLLNATIWLAEIDDFPEMNRVWTDWLPPAWAPAPATVGALLALPTLLVEVAVIAATGAH